jgi:hypothetical protein
MNTTDELAGIQLMVSADVGEDPLNMQGKRGVLAFVDLENDDMYVSFGPQMGKYPSEGLLAFRNPTDIYSDLLSNAKNLVTQDVKDLYRIGMLLDSKQAKDEQMAMDIAIGNPHIHAYAFVNLQDKLKVDRQPEQQTEMSFNRGR